MTHIVISFVFNSKTQKKRFSEHLKFFYTGYLLQMVRCICFFSPSQGKRGFIPVLVFKNVLFFHVFKKNKKTSILFKTSILELR